MEDHEDHKDHFGKGLLVGGLIGVVAMLLYAPKSGKELRTDLKKRMDDLKKGAGRYVRKLKKDGQLILVRTREKAEAVENAVAGAAQQFTGGKKGGSRNQEEQ